MIDKAAVHLAEIVLYFTGALLLLWGLLRRRSRQPVRVNLSLLGLKVDIALGTIDAPMRCDKCKGETRELHHQSVR